MTYAKGALPSPYDPRTFKYDLAKAESAPWEAGERWTIEHEDQARQGICTASAMVGRAEEHYGVQFSADFQYLLQKKFIDGNWQEGSSAFSALKAAYKYGLLREEHWTHTTQEDREKLSYFEYSTKLKNIPDKEVQRLIDIAIREGYRPRAYAECVNVHRDTLASAIASSGSLITRFVIGNEWYRHPIEPLQAPKNPISGHLVNISKIQGTSYRVENNWGDNWADRGSAYGFLNKHTPTEAWQVWFAELPKQIEEQQKEKELETLRWLLKSALAELIKRLRELIK